MKIIQIIFWLVVSFLMISGGEEQQNHIIGAIRYIMGMSLGIIQIFEIKKLFNNR